MKTCRDYIAEHCGKKGEQRSNLTKGEQQGLKSLNKCLADGSLLVIKNDKSTKLAVTDRPT